MVFAKNLGGIMKQILNTWYYMCNYIWWHICVRLFIYLSKQCIHGAVLRQFILFNINKKHFDLNQSSMLNVKDFSKISTT